MRGIEFTCVACQARFRDKPYKKRKYCSLACSGVGRRKEGPRRHDNRYAYRYAPGHPLATRSSPIVTEHRLALWDKIGPGTHPCHHCQEPVTWSPDAKCAKGALVVDHLNGQRQDNDPANLVPSCTPCNARRRTRERANAIQPTEPSRIARSGARRRGALKNCEYCSSEFVTWPTSRPGHGRFCSKSCAGLSRGRASRTTT